MLIATRHGSEKTATAGGRKQGFCIYCPIMIILRYNDSMPPWAFNENALKKMMK